MVSRGDLDLLEKRSELDAVLRSREFGRSPTLAKLLEYLCEKTFTGQIQEIKEFSIATEVFGRDLDFGEKRDSLVRVDVHRLRRKLQRYYETEGADNSVRIVIKPGNYQPDFKRVAALPDLVAAEPEAEPEMPGAPAHKLLPRFAAAAAITAILVTVGLAAVRFRGTQTRESTKPRSQPAPLLAASEKPQPVRILAGSLTERSVDRFGSEWLGDRYYLGGDQNVRRFGSQERSVRHPVILGAADQTPFQSFRTGEFSYRIPLPSAKYELRLYFSEVVLNFADSGDGAENGRIFDVNINGKPLLRFSDIFSDAGAADTADIRVFENVSPAPDGFLKLDFHPVREAAWLNAIELIPNASGRALPLRIVAKNTNYTDHKGQIWGIDRYFIGGKESSEGNAPSGTEDPVLFTGQRYGHFSYRLPVPWGRYTLRLLFAESFFGPGNRGKGGVGNRVFNVYCSGVAILRSFDIFKEAGENRAIEKVFHGITPNPAGRIDLTFEPVENYAIVDAIELTPEDTR